MTKRISNGNEISSDGRIIAVLQNMHTRRGPFHFDVPSGQKLKHIKTKFYIIFSSLE